MKKIFTLAGAFFLAAGCFAQTTLTYKDNGLRIGDHRSLKKMEYQASTPAGPNQIWDYSKAKEINTNMYIDQAENMSAVKNNSNIFLACDEGGSKNTFFEISNSQKMYWGLESKNAKIAFEQPIVDLKFPFAYGDAINGAMIGTYTVGDQEFAINGAYTTSADAWGTLIMPDGNVYENALRIKVEKNYEQAMGSVNYQIHTVRYQYFAEGVRYPVLIVLESDMKSDCNCACGNSKSTEAFFATPDFRNLSPKSKPQDNLAIKNFSYEVSPNPFENELTATFKLENAANVSINLIDNTGKVAASLVEAQLKEGDYAFTTNTENLPAGQYTISVVVDGKKAISSKVIKK